jgi:RNA polymerase Rpb2, domain 6
MENHRVSFHSSCTCKPFTRSTILYPWLATARSILDVFDYELERLLLTYACIEVQYMQTVENHFGFAVCINTVEFADTIYTHSQCNRHSAKRKSVGPQQEANKIPKPKLQERYKSQFLPVPIGTRLYEALKEVHCGKQHHSQRNSSENNNNTGFPEQQHLQRHSLTISLEVIMQQWSVYTACPICMLDDYCLEPLGGYWMDDILYYVPQLLVTDNRKPHISPSTGQLCWYIENVKYEEEVDCGGEIQGSTGRNPVQSLVPLKSLFQLARDELLNASVYTFGRALVKLIENILGPLYAIVKKSAHYGQHLQGSEECTPTNCIIASCHISTATSDGDTELNADTYDLPFVKVGNSVHSNVTTNEQIYAASTKERTTQRIKCYMCMFVAHISAGFRALDKKLRKGNVDSAISKQRVFKTTELSSQDNMTMDSSLTSCSQDVNISKIMTTSGYVSKQERHRKVSEHTPINYMNIILALVKLVSFSVNTSHHQTLLMSQLGNVCIASTTEGKNAGRNLVFVQGVRISNRTQSVRDSSILFAHLLRAKADLIASGCGHDPYFQDNECSALVVGADGLHHHIQGKWPRLDKIILLVIWKHNVSLDFYLDFTSGVAFMAAMPDILLDPVTKLSSMTRMWLSKYYDFAYGNLFSAHCKLTKLLSVTASQIPFLQHSNAPKIILSVTANRHNAGYPSKHIFQLAQMGATCLLYPQKSVICRHLNDSISPVLNLFLAYASVDGNNIEDGLIMCKSGAERGLGMTTSHSTVTFLCTSSDLEKHVDVKIRPRVEDSPTYSTSQCHGLGGRGIRLQNNMPFLELSNCSTCKSFGYKYMFVHSNSQTCKIVVYNNPYALDASGYEYLVNVSVEHQSKLGPKSNQTVVVLYLETVSYTLLGDKYSNRHGQKTTVNWLCSQESMPFFMDASGRLPPNPDILVNFSSQKRLTIGADLEGMLGTSSCAAGTNVCENTGGESSMEPGLTLHREYFRRFPPFGNGFMATSAEERSSLVKSLIQVGVAERFVGIPLCCGKTGTVLGNADVLCVSYEKYQQTSSKVYYCSTDETANNKQPQTAQAVKSKGRLGRNGAGQMEQATFFKHGDGSHFRRSLYDQSEIGYEHENVLHMREQTQRVIEVMDLCDIPVCML